MILREVGLAAKMVHGVNPQFAKKRALEADMALSLVGKKIFDATYIVFWRMCGGTPMVARGDELSPRRLTIAGAR